MRCTMYIHLKNNRMASYQVACPAKQSQKKSVMKKLIWVANNSFWRGIESGVSRQACMDE